MFKWAEPRIDPWQKMEHVVIEPNEAQWRVGSNGINIEDLRLGPLEQVSAGSWQVQLFYKPPTNPGNLNATHLDS